MAAKGLHGIHQGSWIIRAKQRHPDDVTFSSEKFLARCDRVMGIMNGYLNGRAWLATDHGVIADISCFGSISTLPGCEYKKGKWDNVTAWPSGLRALLGTIDPNGYPF